MPTLINPWVLLGLLLIAIALVGTGYVKGRNDANATCEVKIAAMVEAAQKAKDAEAAKANAAATTLESGNANAKVIYKTITQTVDRVVEKPVYLNTCFDSDGLQLANAALAGAAVSPPAGSPAVLPGLNTAK
jgi:hypothetical protein